MCITGRHVLQEYRLYWWDSGGEGEQAYAPKKKGMKGRKKRKIKKKKGGGGGGRRKNNKPSNQGSWYSLTMVFRHYFAIRVLIGTTPT